MQQGLVRVLIELAVQAARLQEVNCGTSCLR
jgi:hypothetical protein